MRGGSGANSNIIPLSTGAAKAGGKVRSLGGFVSIVSTIMVPGAGFQGVGGGVCVGCLWMVLSGGGLSLPVSGLARLQQGEGGR
jgi:hypothetical protein